MICSFERAVTGLLNWLVLYSLKGLYGVVIILNFLEVFFLVSFSDICKVGPCGFCGVKIKCYERLR